MKPNRALLACVLVLTGCYGGGDTENKGAQNPSDTSGGCAPGMIKESGECVPVGGTPDQGGSGGSTTSSGGGTATPTDTSGGAKVPYDKDNVAMVMTRAAAMVKSSCGAATDDSGQATGPWGTTKVSVTLGRNGHVHGVTIPDPYEGKPTGHCAELAFKNLIFPPYAAPADVTVDWDVEIVKPAGK